MGKEALVIKRDTLFNGREIEGFIPIEKRDFISIILDKKNHFYHARGETLENDSSLLQVIPYVWLVNKSEKKAFLYKRVKNLKKEPQDYKETRYLESYSGGVGGHIDRETEEGTKNPIEKAMMRELMEEVIIASYPSPRFIGYLNDKSDSLGSVHFGIVAIAETEENVKTRKSEGLGSGKFYSISEVDKVISEGKAENWTALSWPFVKNYLRGI